MELTKNAEKFICYAYKYYLEQIKQGARIFNSKRVPFECICLFKPFKSYHPDDVKEVIAETSRSGYGDMTMEGNFYINERMIVYMENRFKNGLSDVLDTISKFIP